MVPPRHQLPSPAVEAFLAATGGTLSDAELSRSDGLLVDRGWQTFILEPARGSYVLRLARDCPFDEISPAYLVIFVRRLCALCPGIDIAHRIRCGHPIVASLPISLSERATETEWQSALAVSLPMLEAALGRQREAAEYFHEERPRVSYADPWPEIDVSAAQIGRLAAFAESFQEGLGLRRSDGPERVSLFQECARRMEEHLARDGLLALERDWTPVLLRSELGMGFMDDLDLRQTDASQIVAILNAAIQGGCYSETFLRRAFDGPMVRTLLARAKELAG